MEPAGFDPIVAEWFSKRFGAPTGPQALGWPVIRSGSDALLAAPTGAGKTLAAFLICLDGLLRRGWRGELPDRIEVVYISPLKALSNDVRKNLETPLAEIGKLASSRGMPGGVVRTALRTGDTTAWERQLMLRRPPHVLVTTPESLYILLTADRSRQALRTARTVIVDEIHAVAGNKRGSHLALTLERLDALVVAAGGVRPQRIGLSATVKPAEEMAAFLSAKAEVIDAGGRRAMDLAVEAPRDELGPVATNSVWDDIYSRMAELVREHRTTLVFVNTRRLAERVARELGDRLGHDAVLPHHGSLARRLRLAAEERLKRGELRAIVATSSLELGIDVGAVDLVCQAGSPRSISVALQRIGRSGHWLGAMPKGRLFATTRDELVECAAVVRAMRSGELDRIEIPGNALDVLAQQLAAAASCEDWNEDALFELARGAYPYRALPRADFDAVLAMLAEGFATSRGRAGALLHRDRVNHRVRGRRGARLAAITSGGAIPDTSNYQVVAEPEGVVVGTVDEEFASESMTGDVFLLGTTSWRIRKVEPGRVRVEDARGAAPGIPFWRGEAPGRTAELSREVSRVREAAVESGEGFLIRECGLDEAGAKQAAAYLRAARSALRGMPGNTLVIAERFFDESGGMQLVLHAPFGARINRGWGLALRRCLALRYGFDPQAAATDNGIVLSLTDQQSFPLESVFAMLEPETVEPVLTAAILDTPMFRTRWRWNASRALAIPRFAGGRKVPPHLQRMRADDLLASVFPALEASGETSDAQAALPGHPLIRETVADCLREAIDLDGLKAVLRGLRAGMIRTAVMDTPGPSPLAQEIVNANPYAYLDDVPMEERRTRAVAMRRALPPELAESAGALDPAAIAQVAAESWPVVRDLDELHDALLTLVVLPEEPGWSVYFRELADAGRAAALRVGGTTFWVPAERAAVVRNAYPGAGLEPPAPLAEAAPAGRQHAVTAIVRGWLESTGPCRAAELAEKLLLPREVVETALEALEAEGQVLRGRFTPAECAERAGREAATEWCNRRLLARIHRLTLGRLRREIEPVPAAVFMRFLCRWQHLSAGHRLHGVDGTLAVLRQLQGFEAPAAAWEAQILPARIARYDPAYLDRLCLSGEVMWGRLSPHPAFEETEAGSSGGGSRRRRVRPTRAAPVAIFLRDDAAWLPAGARGSEEALSYAAREARAELERRGALFFAELVKATRRLPSEIEDALWELVAAGLVTADGFENLRSLTDPKRRRGEGRGRSARPRHAGGRWSLLRPALPAQERGAARAFEPAARQLLRRWGVVFRDLLAREPLAPPWRDLVVPLRTLEFRGEVRGGRFIAGFTGEQFALPEAVDLLRAVRREGPVGERLKISPADPLNLTGIVLPGSRVSALAGVPLLLADGVVE